MKQRQPRTLGVAQTCPVKGDLPANLDQHLRLSELAAEEGAQVLLFPELSLTGYEIGSAADLAFTLDDARLTPLADAASSLSVALVVGAPARVGDRLHVGAFILLPDGSTELYTKRRLGAFSPAAGRHGVVPPPEWTVFQAGDMSPVIRFGGNVAAVAVCADIGLPSHPLRAVEDGANTYLASMFVIPSDYEGDAARLATYATEHGMAAALANFGCASGGLASAGRSAIWDDAGRLVVRLGPRGAGVAVAEETAAGWRGWTRLAREAAPATIREARPRPSG